MRRLVRPVLGLLFVAGLAVPANAQQRAPGRAPGPLIEELRPNPVLPAALVPFVIPEEMCRNNNTPLVALKVYDALAVPVATLRLRSRRAELLDSIRMRCGKYVAIWDGTIGGGTRVPPSGVYYVNLAVDDRLSTRKVVITNP
ncbi:MAG: hypothetical protein ABIZ70_02775 [Gemmatimonadales bacterium]